jgi:hypothetical protein
MKKHMRVEELCMIPMRERYSIIGDILTLIESDSSSREDISYAMGSYSTAISVNFIRYLNSNTYYTSQRHTNKIETVNEGLSIHGISPLISVLMSTKRSNVPDHFFTFFSLLSQNVHDYLQLFFSEKGTQDSKVDFRNRQKAQTYSLLFGLEALIYLENDYRKNNLQSNKFESHYHTFHWKMHKNICQIGKKLSLPTYISQREENLEKIPNSSFSNFEVTMAMNYLLGMKGIGFLGSKELNLDKEKLNLNSKIYSKNLENHVKKNPGLSSIFEFEINSENQI